MNIVALLIVIGLCWFGMAFLGGWYHRFFSGGSAVEVPNDASALLHDSALTRQAPCDTCDGIGGGQVNGELMLCPDCRGTGVVRS